MSFWGAFLLGPGSQQRLPLVVSLQQQSRFRVRSVRGPWPLLQSRTSSSSNVVFLAANANNGEQPSSNRRNEDDAECQLLPTSRWRCPQWNDVCAQTGITLSRYMMEMARLNPELDEVESIMTSLQVACKTLSSLVRTSSLNGLTGLEAGGGSINVQGEEQKKLDVIANDVLKNALKWTGKLGTLASEEEDSPVPVDIRGNKVYSSDVIVDNEGRYIAVFDPLDGSSNIDAGTYHHC